MRGATVACSTAHRAAVISIHAPHAGCDEFFWGLVEWAYKFQSTHPMRGATSFTVITYANNSISIHAPHAGCDFTIHQKVTLMFNFNPRTPCGVRRFCRHSKGKWIGFQSTHPMRGATCNAILSFSHKRISIHAPHAGCDPKSYRQYKSALNFNPRTPCGVRHQTDKRCKQ